MSPEDLVRAVFDRVHASDPTVRELYALDAVRIDGRGRRFEGRDAIGRPYVVALLRLPERDGVVGGHYVDLFEIEDGAIRSLWVIEPSTAGPPRRDSPPPSGPATMTREAHDRLPRRRAGEDGG